MSETRNILITGANRGIGLEFVRQYASLGHTVYATTRDNNRSSELRQLKNEYDSDRIHILPLDVTDEASRSNLKNRLGDTPVHLFIQNAGIYGPRGLPIEAVDEKVWLQVLHVNTVSPLKLVALLRTNLNAAKKGAIIGMLSSKMGSNADNSSGGNYPYRTSKAALNCVSKSLAVDLASENIKVVALHPGWVKTDMGGPNALIDTRTSVQGLIKVLSDLTQDQSGLFINYDGRVIPW
jgi:NAD(P)-dependent dehydrogenase (short-subunit alcohol dehydrogenase family)